jgi:hypothetical protein
MRIARMVAVVAIALGMAGCTKVNSSYALLGPPAPAYSGDVRLITAEEPVPANLHEVALVMASGLAPDGDEGTVRERLIDQARALGCSVVARVRVDTSEGSTAITGVCLAP